MNDLIDSTAFLISTGSKDPWVTSVSVLKAVSATIRNAEQDASSLSNLEAAADWIDAQIENFAFSALELKCISSPVTHN